MRPAVSIDYPSGRVIAHNTSAARVAKVKLDIPRKKNQLSVLEPFCQKLAEAARPVS
jgi:hypothetical protein